MTHFIYSLPNHLLALLLCLVAVQAKAQPTPFVGANAILLSTFLADKPAYEAITAVLTEQSLSYTTAENRLLIRSQSNSVFAAKGLAFEGQLKIMGGMVELTGRIVPCTTGENQPLSVRSTPILFAKDRNSGQRFAFAYMDALAKQLQTVLKGIQTYKYQPHTI